MKISLDRGQYIKTSDSIHAAKQPGDDRDSADAAA
jgi:hypothetical protein